MRQKQRALHVAAANDAVHVAGLLIQRGAEIDPYELNYSNTPLDFAVYHEYPRMIDLLRPHSRDVWNLTAVGDVERLREIIPLGSAPGEGLLADHSALLAPGGRDTKLWKLPSSFWSTGQIPTFAARRTAPLPPMLHANAACTA